MWTAPLALAGAAVTALTWVLLVLRMLHSGARLALSRLDSGWSVARTAAVVFVLGVGVGCFMMLVVTIAQDAVALELVGSATSTVHLVRELGVTIGSAAIGSVLAISITSSLPGLFTCLALVFVAGAGLSLLLPDRKLSGRPG